MTTAVLRILGIAGVAMACEERARPLPPSSPDTPVLEHSVLGGSFVSRDTAALRRMLHPDFIVQPPSPDSARQGEAAIQYLLELAAQSTLTESRLEPRFVAPEGPFAFEQGIWLLRSGNRLLWSPYTLRWRAADYGWRVVLWRWALFR